MKEIEKQMALRPWDNTWKNPTLCWYCQNAVPGGGRGCSWSRSFKPVDGWDAEPTQRAVSGQDPDSYRVADCPEFIPDPIERPEWDVARELREEQSRNTLQDRRRRLWEKLRQKHEEAEK